jgi:hypothetical protein
MRRQPLLSVIGLGVVVSLIGGAGIFAVFTDRATTGNNSAISADQPHFEALQLALASPVTNPDSSSSVVCGAFADDLAVPLVTLTNLQPNDYWTEYLCVRNVGTIDLSLTATAVDLLESETACTGDEGAFDSTCGGAGPGELAALVRAVAGSVDCASATPAPYASTWLASLGAGSWLDLGIVSGGSTACYYVGVWYPSWTAALDVQIAQTDQVTWRFALDGTE